MSNWPTLNDLIGRGGPLGGAESSVEFLLPESNRPAEHQVEPPAFASSAREGSTLDVLVPVKNPEVGETGEPVPGEDGALPSGFDAELPPSLVSALAVEGDAVEYDDAPDMFPLGDPDFEEGAVLSFSGEPVPDDLGDEGDQYEPDLPELTFA